MARSLPNLCGTAKSHMSSGGASVMHKVLPTRETMVIVLRNLETVNHFLFN